MGPGAAMFDWGGDDSLFPVERLAQSRKIRDALACRQAEPRSIVWRNCPRPVSRLSAI